MARQHRTLLLLAALSAMLSAGFQAAPGSASIPGPPGDRAGEPCLVCRHPVPETGERHVHRGRDVLLCSGPCVEEYQRDPATYFAALQAHGALFDEEATKRTPTIGWLYFGVYVLAGLVFGAGCAYLAIARGRRAAAWFLAGLAANLPALLVLLARPALATADPQGVPPGLRKVPTTHAPVRCAKCGVENHPSAATCSGCDAALTPSVESEIVRSQQESR